MDESAQQRLIRWKTAGLIDSATVARIEAWERTQAPTHTGRLGRFAFAFGGLMLGAGVLLFVAANWDQVSPWSRLALLAAVVGVLHVGGAIVESRSAALARTLHAVGTGALGGGIFLAGQAFNLAASWPQGVLAWLLGAAFALWLRRDWPHVLWVAVLGPLWLLGEWVDRSVTAQFTGTAPIVGLTLLSVAYVAAVGPHQDDPGRRALARLGAIALLPLAAMLLFTHDLFGDRDGSGAGQLAVVWSVALLVPMVAGAWLRGLSAWPLLPALAIAFALTRLDKSADAASVYAHALYATAAAGMVWWGIREGQRLRVNLGVVGFALTVLSFYYSNVFDKFGRSLGLIGLGLLFIVGGWWLERTRRSLLERIEETAP